MTANIDGLDRLLGIDELSAYLDVPKQTLYNWRSTGYGPVGVRIGRKVKYPVSHVRTFIEQQVA